MTYRHQLRATLLALGLGLASSLAFAGPAQDTVKARQAQLSEQLKKGKAADEGKITAIFDELLDYDTLARESLGKAWEERTDAERQEYTQLLKRLVRGAYRKNLNKTANYTVEYSGEIAGKQGRQVVQTIARSKSNRREEPVAIDYVLRQDGGAWRVVDIVTEGSSLVGNYRSQFSRIVKKDGFAALIAKMKKKADKEG